NAPGRSGSKSGIGAHSLTYFRSHHYAISPVGALYAAVVESINGRTPMKTRPAFALGAIAVLGSALAISVSDSLAQQMQRVSYKSPVENAKYTQQHVIDVGDAPGHQVRVYEIHRTFPNNAPI